MRKAFFALLAIVVGLVVVPLAGYANRERLAGITHAADEASHIRRLWERYSVYCDTHNGTAGIAPSHVRMHPYPHGVLPIADRLRLPVGRPVSIYLERCQDGTQGWIRELAGGKTLTYFATPR